MNSRDLCNKFALYGAMLLCSGTFNPANAQNIEPLNNTVENNQGDFFSHGLERTKMVNTSGINEKGETYANKTRHIYDWNQVMDKYVLNPEVYNGNTKSSDEDAAEFMAIKIYEASTKEAQEESHFYANLIGNTDKMPEATSSKDNYSLVLYKVKESFRKNPQLIKQAKKELDAFIKDNNKDISFTDSVDKEIKNNTSNKTLSAEMFMKIRQQQQIK